MGSIKKKGDVERKNREKNAWRKEQKKKKKKNLKGEVLGLVR